MAHSRPCVRAQVLNLARLWPRFCEPEASCYLRDRGGVRARLRRGMGEALRNEPLPFAMRLSLRGLDTQAAAPRLGSSERSTVECETAFTRSRATDAAAAQLRGIG